SADRFIVSWTGSTSTLAHFERARAPLERLAKTIPLTVKVICNVSPSDQIAGAEFQFVPWSKTGEAHEIGACHAGIMPLPDNEATRGKCGLKALQFMAAGRATVASPVGMNRDLIQHGENGLLASTDDEFVDALLELSRSPETRRVIGHNGRKTIEQGYSASAVAARFAIVVRALTDPAYVPAPSRAPL
ncbi:MAG: glycosyltransferase, partial [Sphingomicrobium sp.]